MNESKRIVAVFRFQDGKEIDLDLPCSITVKELYEGLCEGFHRKIEEMEGQEIWLRSENPIAFLRGDHTLEEYHLRDGCFFFLPFSESGDKK